MSSTSTPSDRPLLRELIDIPERVHQGDFVLKLADGISEAQAAATVASYVVTPQLARAFDEALGFIQRAVTAKRSAACYLHGSFGSGKSHFMAVLDLLLAGNLSARAIPELAAAVNANAPWMAGKRFLMVPFHMIGARDVESAILGGYAEHVRRFHPEAPTPGFYLGEKLFDDARSLRRTMGDEAFFSKLNADAQEGDEGWGDLGAAWDADAFESAALEAPDGEERQRLVGDLIRTFFSSYADVALAKGEAFVDLDTGLAIMSQHAKRLGYDAVVLFLDELILWLATWAADVNFVSSEGAKLSKLVEAQRADRPIPIISFVARQRDLRELVGEHQAGALQLQFADTLKYWEARFDRVVLEDRNLPVIARRRLLRPTSETARQQLDAAFDEFACQRRDVLETLLGTDGERDLFRMIYPFSPALVQALIAASSVLQRERTALKLMLTLLVERRNELRLGALIPVGDLWDAISTGDQPFSDGMRLQFENAKKLWTQKLLPLLEQTHGVAWQDLQDNRADPVATRNFRNDARLLKTLLLAALVPEVPALRGLTADRLAALNHGSVVSPVPGREKQTVLTKLRSWAAQVGEIRITEDANPTISLQITGVDVAPILANAAHYDNDGTRRSKVQKILFEAFGIPVDTGLMGAQGMVHHKHLWRHTTRDVDLCFEAVKDLPDERLRGRPGAPTVVLGMPFDFQGRSPADHRARLQEFPDDESNGGVVWLPSYLSDRTLRDLGTLVRIDYLLTGERLQEASRHLSATDREQARAVLRSQQSALGQRVRSCIEAAYGIRPDQDGCLGAIVTSEDRLVPLDGTFQPQTPVGATLKDALNALLDRIFEHRFPAHPQFEQDVRPTALKRILDDVQRAAEQPGQRLGIDDHAMRHVLRGIAGPLKLGTMGQTHFVLSPHWADHFGRMQSQANGAAMTVERLRTWIDLPQAMGLTPELQNLVVLAFAAQADRTLMRHGVPVQGIIERLDPEIEICEQPLPDETEWSRARERANALFGLTSGEVRKGATLARLAADLKQRATDTRPILASLATDLRPRLEEFGVAPDTAARMVTLRSASAFTANLLDTPDALTMIRVLIGSKLETSEAAVARALGSSGDLKQCIAGVPWEAIAAACSLHDHRAPAAKAIQGRVAEALSGDEHVVPLEPALRDVEIRSYKLLADTRSGPQVEPPTVAGDVQFEHPPSTDEEVIDERATVVLTANQAVEALDALRLRVAAEPNAKLTIAWRLIRAGRGGTI